ncbi:acyltransferase family protein [Dietzia maris]|uniref:acyltransferase family protein n=1 Tax=Dietzia maris TaxID=37915 RepID=UPI003450FB8D
MTTATPDLASSTRGAKATSNFRLDIEGLRAIAVVFVVIWHAGVPQLPGGFIGVDVFFVISGFLMTGILYRELTTSGRILFLDFFARRVKRLIPASALTVAVTLIAAWLILPASRVLEIAYDAIAATLYVVNWRLSEGSVDYFAQDQTASPLQHFWSLSVEEQFYILWPLLLGAVAVLVAWGLFSSRTGITSALLVIFVASLVWSVVYTGDNAGRAYFVTTTRLWELALGGLVAVALAHRSSFPKALSICLSWAGLVAVVASGLFLTTEMPFPGWIALLPTLGTAALIAFTPSAGRGGPLLVLSLRPMTWLGSISYSLYLWHWPVLIFGAAVLTSAAREITVMEGLVLAALSVLPAWLSLKYVENPVRRADWTNASHQNTFFMALVATALPLALAMSMATTIRVEEPIRQAQSLPAAFLSGPSSDNAAPVGAAMLQPDPATSPSGEVQDIVDSVYPRPSDASASLPPHQRDGCHTDIESDAFEVCEYGDAQSEFSIMIAGDSHAAQWVPALIDLSDEKGWRLVVATKSTCPLNMASIRLANVGDYAACARWNRSALSYIEGPDRPDVLLHTNSVYTTAVQGGTDAFVAGGVEVIERARNAGVSVVALRDTPRPSVNVAECVASNLDSLSACAFDREEALASSDQAQSVMVARTGIPTVDLTSWICPRELCAPVIGGILVWRDSNHLTNEYSRTLSEPLSTELDRVGV